MCENKGSGSFVARCRITSDKSGLQVKTSGRQELVSNTYTGEKRKSYNEEEEEENVSENQAQVKTIINNYCFLH